MAGDCFAPAATPLLLKHSGFALSLPAAALLLLHHFLLLLRERAALRNGEAVAVVTLTNWLLGLMIAATENPAQLLFGVVCVVVFCFFF